MKRNIFGGSVILPALLLVALFFGVSNAGMMQEDLNGQLKGSGGHRASGTVSIQTDSAGMAKLQLIDIDIDKVPDGHVYLAVDGDYRKGLELGVLKQFNGSTEFAIPQGTMLDNYNSVVIWCEKFSVEIGRASLTMK